MKKIKDLEFHFCVAPKHPKYLFECTYKEAEKILEFLSYKDKPLETEALIRGIKHYMEKFKV